MATPKPPSTDQELAAVKAVLAAIDSLEPGSKHRVLRAAEALLAPQHGMFPPPLPRGNQPQSGAKH